MFKNFRRIGQATKNLLTPKFLTQALVTIILDRSSRLQAAWKSTKQLAAFEATMNIKY